METKGSEHIPLAMSRMPISEDARTESGTVDAPKAPLDLDLAFVQNHWGQLPEAARSAILAIVRAAADEVGE